MNNFSYKKVSGEEAALAEFSAGKDAMFLAGGTNLLDLWKYNILHPQILIDISGIEDNSQIYRLEDGSLRLGAAAKNADTAYHPLVEEHYPILSDAILAGASAQIRNMASNGGNLLQKTRCLYFYDTEFPCNKRTPGEGCSALGGYNRMNAVLGTSEHCIAVFPSDMCVALAALAATVQVSGPQGTRTIPFKEFHRLPGDQPQIDNTLQEGEIITSINLPPEGFSQNYSYLKIRDRHSYAFALVSVATCLKIENGVIAEARIALGGLAHKPWRSSEAEEFLKGKTPDEENFAKAADLIMAGAKGFGENDFKIPLAKKAIVRNGLMALHPEHKRPGAQPSL